VLASSRPSAEGAQLPSGNHEGVAPYIPSPASGAISSEERDDESCEDPPPAKHTRDRSTSASSRTGSCNE
jgi:hypothetical protein